MLLRYVLLVWILCVTVGVLSADVPSEIVYQGKLKEYGQLVNGTRSIQFKVFDSAANGNQIGAAYGGSILVTQGQFSYVLSLAGVDWTHGEYWLETIVEGKIMSPREKLTAQPFALHARTAEDIHKAAAATSIDFVIGTSTKVTIPASGDMSCRVGSTDYYMVPRGAIVMWSGAIASIPSGWALCDGTGGTPDLRDRFILSVSGSGENPGTTGGTHSITLTTNQLPSHAHSGTTSTDGNHAHSISVPWGGGSSDGVSVHTSYTGSTQAGALSGASIGSSGAHSHSFTTGTSGSGSAIDIRPAYYKIAYIIRL